MEFNGEDTEENYVKGGTKLPPFIRPNNNAEDELFKYSQNEYVHGIITTISGFEKSLAQPRFGSSDMGYCVLVLPPLSKWAVFITSAVLRELFTSLTAVSIGPSGQLRLVICHEDVLQRKIMKDILAVDKLQMTGSHSERTEATVTLVETAKNTFRIKRGWVYESRDENKQEALLNDTSNSSSCTTTLQSQVPQPKCSTEDALFGSRILDDPLPKDEEALKAYQPHPDCTWTSLTPCHLTDILQAMGQVWIMKPDWTKLEDVTDICPHFESGELAHTLEVYDFPPEFVEKDISEIFEEFKTAGFSIYWTDDTHAIVRFSAKEVAEKALQTIQHPALKCRPVSSASRQTKLMLASSRERRLPFKRRPATESNTAKRLILSSLGLRTREPRPRDQSNSKS